MENIIILVIWIYIYIAYATNMKKNNKINKGLKKKSTHYYKQINTASLVTPSDPMAYPFLS